jgi:hypothetical protein
VPTKDGVPTKPAAAPSAPVASKVGQGSSTKPRDTPAAPASKAAPSPGAKPATSTSSPVKAPVPTAGSIAEAEARASETKRQPAVSPSGVAPVDNDSASRKRRPKPYEEAPKESKKPSVAPTRKARLRVYRVDPWSVMKMAFALAIALGIVTVVAVVLVWAVLGAAGVWDAINQTVATVLNDNADAFDISEYVGFGRIIGLTIVIAAIDVILITALATVGAFLYNLAAQLLGGLEVTLAEDD